MEWALFSSVKEEIF